MSPPLSKKEKFPKYAKTSVTFDEQSRLEYVQGMRKRKNERRKKASNAIRTKMKKERKAYDKRKRQLIMEEVAALEKLAGIESEDSDSDTSPEESPTIPGTFLVQVQFTQKNVFFTKSENLIYKGEVKRCLGYVRIC